MDTVNEVRKLLSSLRKSFHCTICLDLLSQPISTKCNHQFCSGCFKELLSKSSSKHPSKCPLCMTGVTKRGVYPNPNLAEILSAVRNVCEAADDDCEHLGGTPLLSQRVRDPVRTTDADGAKKGKKCLSFIGLEDEKESFNYMKVEDNVPELKYESKGQATRIKNKSTNVKVRKKGDFFSKKKGSSTVTGEKIKDVGQETEEEVCDHAKENVHPDGISEVLPSVGISSSLNASDKDALVKIYNSQNNLLNRLKKRQKLKEIPDVIYEQPERQEKTQKRKSDELIEEPDIGDDNKKKKKLGHNLYSDPTEKENKLKVSKVPNASQIDSNSSKSCNTSEKVQTQHNIISSKVIADEKESNQTDYKPIAKDREHKVSQQSFNDEVPQSVPTDDTASSVLPNAGFNLERIINDEKSCNIIQDTTCLSEEVSNNCNKLCEESSNLISNHQHSDILSPSPCDNQLNKSLMENEAFKSNHGNISSHKRQSNEPDDNKYTEFSLNDKSKTSEAEKHECELTENQGSNELSNLLASADLFKSIDKNNEICGNKMVNIPGHNVNSVGGLPALCKDIVESEDVTENRMVGTPETSVKYSDAKCLQTPKSYELSVEGSNELNTPKSNNSQGTSPKTPTTCQIEKNFPMSSPAGINSFIKFPKTPKASQIVRIEKDADLIYLLKKIPSPNKDLLLFGNLSFSKVILPYRKEGKSFELSRRSIGSRDNSGCHSKSGLTERSELSGVSKIDNTSNLHPTSVTKTEKEECSQTDTTQDSELSTGSKINKRRKSRRRSRLMGINKIEDVNCNDIITGGEQKNVEQEQKNENVNSLSDTTEESGLSANSKIIKQRTSQRQTDFSDETNEVDANMQSLLTDTTQESNSSVNNKLNKKLNSKHRKILKKKVSTSVKCGEGVEHIEAISGLLQNKSPITHSRIDRDQLQTCVDNSECYEEGITNENDCIQGEMVETGGTVDKVIHRNISYRNENDVLSNKHEDITVQVVVEDILVKDSYTDFLPEDKHSETLNKSFQKSAPHSEELIPPTPPISNVSSKLNKTDKFYSMKNFRNLNVDNATATEKQVDQVHKANDLVKDEVTRNITKKTGESAISNTKNQNVLIASKTEKNISKTNKTAFEKEVFDDELTCSDEAFFADVDKYESEGSHSKSKDVKHGTNPISLQKDEFKIQLNKKDNKLDKNRNLIEEGLDSSFTCTDKLLCDEDLESVSYMSKKNEKTFDTSMKNETTFGTYDSKRIINEDLCGISNTEGNFEELEDDIEIYTGCNRENQDECKADYLGCFLNEELSVSILSTAPPATESMAPARESDTQSSDEDKTIIEEIMYVKGNNKAIESKDAGRKCGKQEVEKTEINDTSSLKNEFMSNEPITFDNAYSNTDLRESVETEVVTVLSSTGKKFRQSLKNIITEESEGSRPVPSQSSVDFAVCSPDVAEYQNHPQKGSTISEEACMSHAKKHSVIFRDVETPLNTSDGEKFHPIKNKQKDIGREADTLLPSDVKRFIENDDEDSSDHFLILKKAKSQKLQKPLQDMEWLNNRKLKQQLSEKGDHKDCNEEIFKRENSSNGILKHKKSKSLEEPECKRISQELSRKEDHEESNVETLKLNISLQVDNDIEDQLFSPIPTKKISRINDGKLKSAKQDLSCNADNSKEELLIPNTKSGTVYSVNNDSKEKVIQKSVKDNLLSKQNRKYESRRKYEGIQLVSSKKIDDNQDVNTSHSSSILLDKKPKLFEEYTSPPKVKRLSDENIPPSLKFKSEQKKNNISSDERMVTPTKQDELLDEDLCKTSYIHQSSSKKELSQKGRYPFDANMFSPPTPIERYKYKEHTLLGSCEKGSFMNKNRYLQQKIFSPPNSKNLLNDSVEDNTPKHKEKQFSRQISRSKLKDNVLTTPPNIESNTVRKPDNFVDNSSMPRHKQFSPPNTKRSLGYGSESNPAKTPQNIESNTSIPHENLSTEAKHMYAIQEKESDYIGGNARKRPVNNELPPTTPLRTDLIPIAQSTAYRQQRLSGQGNRKVTKKNNTLNIESNTSEQPHNIVDNSSKPQQKRFSPLSTTTSLERGIESSPSKAPQNVESNTSKPHENLNTQRKHMYAIQEKALDYIGGNAKKRPVNNELSPTTPLRTDLIPIAQSTTYRQQHLVSERSRKITSGTNTNESKAIQSNNQKGPSTTSNIEHGTPKSIRGNFMQNVHTSTQSAHTTTVDIDGLNMIDIVSQPRSPVIMTSRLAKKQMMYCYSVCQKLGGKIVQNYSDSVTHLIVLADENNTLSKMAYTYKYLMALVSGHWIVTLKWIFVSSQKGKFIDEETFEAKGDATAHHTNIPRLFRTASEEKRRCIFENYRMYVVGSFQQTQISREQLFMLLQKCGVEVIFSHTEVLCSSTQVETVLLTDNLSQLSAEDIELCNKHHLRPVHPDWVVESIINFRVEDTMLYILQPVEE